MKPTMFFRLIASSISLFLVSGGIAQSIVSGGVSTNVYIEAYNIKPLERIYCKHDELLTYPYKFSDRSVFEQLQKNIQLQFQQIRAFLETSSPYLSSK